MLHFNRTAHSLRNYLVEFAFIQCKSGAALLKPENILKGFLLLYCVQLSGSCLKSNRCDRLIICELERINEEKTFSKGRPNNCHNLKLLMPSKVKHCKISTNLSLI